MKKLFLSLIIFTSCSHIDLKDINCIYQGGIIIGKHSFSHEVSYDIKYKGDILNYVQVYDIDSNYKVGDTINKPCIK